MQITLAFSVIESNLSVMTGFVYKFSYPFDFVFFCLFQVVSMGCNVLAAKMMSSQEQLKDNFDHECSIHKTYKPPS